MAGKSIDKTTGEYDEDVFNKLPKPRKKFWERQGVDIVDGIRTDVSGKREIYMRVRKKGKKEPMYFENELNKTFLDNK